MVQNLVRPTIKPTTHDFPDSAPTAQPVFYRTYSRRQEDLSRETWEEVCDRTVTDVALLGQFTAAERDLVERMQRQLKAMVSGRALWVMGTPWIHQPENFSGSYNCTSTNVVDWDAFGLMMDLAMMGCGTGAVLEPKYIDRLPQICNRLELRQAGEVGSTLPGDRIESTMVQINGHEAHVKVGDSRRGWVDSYQALMELASDPQFGGVVEVTIDLSDVRPAGEKLKGFGGVANPVKLGSLYGRCVAILNRATGRQLNSVECCLLIDEAASCIVAGNIRRSAGMRQFDSEDTLGSTAKDNLWQQDAEGNWRIDPERDALRMANHTRVFHRKPTLQECTDAVRKQFYSGEGAIQWAGEAVARANRDLIKDETSKQEFLEAYVNGSAKEWLQKSDPNQSEEELEDRISRYGLNPCGEIIGTNYHCVSGNTYLITAEGMSPIQDVEGELVQVWNGHRWSEVTPIKTGHNRQLYRVSFNDGSYLDVTEGHRFFVRHRFQSTYQEMTTTELIQEVPIAKYALHTEAFQIKHEGGTFVDPIYAYTLGQLVGDGSASEMGGRSQLYLKLYGDKNQQITVLGNTSGKLRQYVGGGNAPCLLYTGLKQDFDVSTVRALKYTAAAFDSLAVWNREGILNFVAGLADADGSVTEAGGIRIYISDYERAYRVYLLLLKCGIRSSINLVQRAGAKTNYGTRNYDLWYLQITDCSAIPCQRLDTQRGHQPKAKGKWQVIRSIEALPGLHDTYCFNEPEFHKGVFGGTLTGQCNLSEIHLNQLDPENLQEQKDAFTSGGLVVAALLNHQFQVPRYQRSREWDPIVGVSFTGLFDFFVKAFGVEWLQWWEQGRPKTAAGIDYKERERAYLERWRDTVHETIWEYCDRHGLRRPNRCTTVQPSGTKSLLTGASPGWHPPKAQRYIRRITFAKGDPVAMACIDYGYSVVPSQSDKDDQGNLLNDPFDPRVTEWLVELPVEVPWANLPGADQIEIEQFSALAQFDFYMQVQKYWTTHNTSATLELREEEVEDLATKIYEAIQADEGYMSAALLARFDAPFPRLPFEKINRDTYDRMSTEVLNRRVSDDFLGSVVRYDQGEMAAEGPAGCDAMGCLMPEATPNT
ncbi:MAG: ribonucleoside-triphosphate reductase, adenosylcobalamin-dependent [Cyanophyceae cyanobacterium]